MKIFSKMKLNRILASLLVFAFLLGQINIPQFVFANEQTDDIDISISSELNEEKTQEEITIVATPKESNIEVKSIILPSGDNIDGNEALYTATENGSIDFVINYTITKEVEIPSVEVATSSAKTRTILTETEDGSTPSEETETETETTEPETTQPEIETQIEEKSITITHNVSEIIETEENEQTEENEEDKEIADSLKPETTSAPNASFSIPEYDDVAWANGAIKNVTLNVTFPDNTTGGKKIEFTLPDGMKYMTIPASSGYVAESGVDTLIIKRLNADDSFGKSITAMSIPTKETQYDGKATYGKIAYELLPGTESVSFEIGVRLDANKYYGETDLKEAMKIEAFMGGASFASQEKTIHANGRVVGYANQEHVSTMFRNWFAQINLKDVLASTPDEPSYNYTKIYSIVSWLNETDYRGARRFQLKESLLTLYYPKEMEFVSLVDLNGNNLSGKPNLKVTDYPGQGKVEVEIKYETTNSYMAVKYKIPEGLAAGTYTADEVPTAKMETYDGEIFTSKAYTSNPNNNTAYAALDTVNVLDPSSRDNKMEMIAGGSHQKLNFAGETSAGRILIRNIKTPGKKTNQMFNIKFDPNWDAYEVRLPFDETIVGNKITDVKYKTNLDSSFRAYTGELKKIDKSNRVLNKTMVGLVDGEYFTEVEANIGDFSVSYYNYIPNSSDRQETRISYGKQKEGTNSVDFVASIWAKDDEANTKTTTTSTFYNNKDTLQSRASKATIAFYDKDNKQIKNAIAGETITAKSRNYLDRYPFGTLTNIENPVIYLRNNEGINIDKDSIILKNNAGATVDFDIEETTALTGEKIYILKTKNIIVGDYIGYPIKPEIINLEYKMSASITLDETLNLNGSQMVAWGGSNIVNTGTNNFFNDKGIDIDNDGIDNERLLGMGDSNLAISKLDAVLVETFLSLKGEAAKDPYIEGDENTIAYFTPGTEADYTVKITNTAKNEPTAFDLYIPIPKTGQNFGEFFQKEPFKWDMKLSGGIRSLNSRASDWEFYYATDATKENFETTANYLQTPANFADVNMVKIVMKTPLVAGAEKVFKIPLVVDETFQSANDGNKIGTKNIYNPFYRLSSPSYTGVLAGTKVGTELVIAEIGGTIFKDNDGNGIYEKDKGDIPLPLQEVLLYKFNKDTNIYEPVNDSTGNQIKTQADLDGVYLFDYTKGLGYGKYAVEFTEKTDGVYQYTVFQAGTDRTIDSDAIITGADRGWVKDIDATRLEAKTIGCGYLEFDPPIDLKVNIDTKEVLVNNTTNVKINPVKQTAGIAAEDTIEPLFFDNIKDETDGYVWTIADTTLATVATQPDGSAIITGISTNGASIAHTTITLTIKDIYGTVKTSTAPLIIKADDSNHGGGGTGNENLLISAKDFTIENLDARVLTDTQAKTNALAKALQEIITGSDKTVNDISNLIIVNTTQLNKIKNESMSGKGGTYPLTFAVTSSTNETANVTINVTVKSNMKPVITTSNITIKQNEAFDILDGVSATDFEDGPITITNANIDKIMFYPTKEDYNNNTNGVIKPDVDTSIYGYYVVTYKIKDSHNNEVTKDRLVTVLPLLIGMNKVPVINAVDKTITEGDVFNPLDGITVTDEDTIILTDANVIVNNVPNPTTPGSYTVTYKATDSLGASSEKTITIKVLYKIIGMNTVPKIDGVADKRINYGSAFNPLDGIVASDIEDELAGIPLNLIVTIEDRNGVEIGAVNTRKPGVYTITYEVTDSQGAKCKKTMQLTVRAEETTEAPTEAPTEATTSKETTTQATTNKETTTQATTNKETTTQATTNKETTTQATTNKETTSETTTSREETTQGTTNDQNITPPPIIDEGGNNGNIIIGGNGNITLNDEEIAREAIDKQLIEEPLIEEISQKMLENAINAGKDISQAKKPSFGFGANNFSLLAVLLIILVILISVYILKNQIHFKDKKEEQEEKEIKITE